MSFDTATDNDCRRIEPLIFFERWHFFL